MATRLPTRIACELFVYRPKHVNSSKPFFFHECKRSPPLAKLSGADPHRQTNVSLFSIYSKIMQHKKSTEQLEPNNHLLSPLTRNCVPSGNSVHKQRRNMHEWMISSVGYRKWAEARGGKRRLLTHKQLNTPAFVWTDLWVCACDQVANKTQRKEVNPTVSLPCQHSHPLPPSYSPPQALLILSLLRLGLFYSRPPSRPLRILSGRLPAPHSPHKSNVHTRIQNHSVEMREHNVSAIFSPILTNKPCIWPPTLCICLLIYLCRCKHLRYFWSIVFDVKMEENHAFKHRGRGTHGLNESREEVKFTERKSVMCPVTFSTNLLKP